MRPIDADKLKESFILHTNLKGYLVADPEILIDNAPTIEFRLFKEWKCTDCKERENSYDAGYKKAKEHYKFTLDDVENFYRRGLEKGLSEWETERPLGEWLDHGKHIECNQCKVWFLKDHLIRKSFCPNCGADMRGENNG